MHIISVVIEYIDQDKNYIYWYLHTSNNHFQRNYGKLARPPKWIIFANINKTWLRFVFNDSNDRGVMVIAILMKNTPYHDLFNYWNDCNGKNGNFNHPIHLHLCYIFHLFPLLKTVNQTYLSSTMTHILTY